MRFSVHEMLHAARITRGKSEATTILTPGEDAARSLPLRAWREVIRRFTDGHTERWWAAELMLFGYGPSRPVRAICATTDRRELPSLSTLYLTTNLPAPLAEIVRIYGLRNWIKQG